MHDHSLQQGVQAGGAVRTGETGQNGATLLRPCLCQLSQSGVAEGRQVQLEAEDRTAVPGRTSADEFDQDIDEVLARGDIPEQILEYDGLQPDMPGERLRLEIGQAGEVVGDRPERYTGPGSDAPMRRPGHPMIRNDVEGDIEDVRPAAGVVATGPPAAATRLDGGPTITTGHVIGRFTLGWLR